MKVVAFLALASYATATATATDITFTGCTFEVPAVPGSPGQSCTSNSSCASSSCVVEDAPVLTYVQHPDAEFLNQTENEHEHDATWCTNQGGIIYVYNATATNSVWNGHGEEHDQDFSGQGNGIKSYWTELNHWPGSGDGWKFIIDLGSVRTVIGTFMHEQLENLGQSGGHNVTDAHYLRVMQSDCSGQVAETILLDHSTGVGDVPLGDWNGCNSSSGAGCALEPGDTLLHITHSTHENTREEHNYFACQSTKGRYVLYVDHDPRIASYRELEVCVEPRSTCA